MKKMLFILLLSSVPSFIFSQQEGNIGVNTATPQKKLHVNGALQVTNELNVGGSGAAAGSAGTAGQYLVSNGAGASPSWQYPAGIVPTSNGSIIAINGQLIVAQEIIALLAADFTISTTGVATPIGNLTNEIIDNENSFAGNASTNSFKISSNGIYEVMMNTQLNAASTPVIGIWNNTTNRWVARGNDNFTAPANGLQTYTLITSIPLSASDTYSFRVASSGGDLTIRAFSSGGTGSGPITQVSVKRLK